MTEELGWRTQEQVSFLFLERFIEKWDSLLKAVASYMALWTKFRSSFKEDKYDKLEEELIRIIKGNLVQVAATVEALNSQGKRPNPQIANAVKTMKDVYQEIILADYITLKQLEKLNSALAVVLAEQFLAPLMRWRGGVSERTYGKVERAERTV